MRGRNTSLEHERGKIRPERSDGSCRRAAGRVTRSRARENFAETLTSLRSAAEPFPALSIGTLHWRSSSRSTLLQAHKAGETLVFGCARSGSGQPRPLYM